MIVKETKVIPEKIIPESVEVIEKIICDVCKLKEAKKVCQFCGRHICKEHMVEIYDYGDYPDRFCSICNELLFKKYCKEFDDIEKEYEEKIDKLNEKVKKESLEIK